MTQQVSNTTDSNAGISKSIKTWGWYIILSIPVIIGFMWQIAMAFFEVEYLYVFLSPPGHIQPLVSLEPSWWVVVLLFSFIFTILINGEKIASIPKRSAIPIYFYILFLLILVKPIW